MGKELVEKRVPLRRRLARRNSMAFPRELRELIPDLHTGQVLELDSISGQAANTQLYGALVELKLVVKETRNESRELVVLMSLQPEAARHLAATLHELADEAESGEASGIPSQ